MEHVKAVEVDDASGQRVVMSAGEVKDIILLENEPGVQFVTGFIKRANR